MATLLGYLWPFLIYYVIQFVVFYIVVEYGQNYFYDEVTPAAGLKVAFGALIAAALLTWARSNFATMFTDQLGTTVFLAIVWSLVFILAFRFQPWHGFGLAIATLMIFTGMSTLVVDSMLSPKPAGRIDTTIENKPIRRPASGSPAPVKAAVPAK